ncbi:hypothetical protein ACFLT9_08735 [Acidobacteriota bacterium]
MTKVYKRKSEFRSITAIVLLLAVVLMAVPSISEAKVCESALERCLIDAVFAAIVSFNPGVLFGYGAGCVMGYEWCLLYYT